MAVDDLADIGGIALTPAGDHLGPDGIEFDADVLDVLGAQVRGRIVVFALYSFHFELSFLTLKLDVAVTGGRGATGLDLNSVTHGGGGDVTGAQVTNTALSQRCDTAEAYAHPAARGHQYAGGFAGIEQGL